MDMSKCFEDSDNSNRSTEEHTIPIDSDLDEWLLASALSHGMSKSTAAIKFLQHGCENHEEILDD